MNRTAEEDDRVDCMFLTFLCKDNTVRVGVI